MKYIGSSWTVAWSPAVTVENDSEVADNAMFVAHDPTQQVYVVAIAGTNALSQYDLRVEDLTVALEPFTASTNIATGTCDGVRVLEAMTDPTTTDTLLTFLNNLGDAQVIFTGHSLGGALAPALALDLVVHQGLKSPAASIRVYPTAGPTPGDAAFAGLFKQTFAPDIGTPAYNSWNVVVWNTCDIVPHAWSMLGDLPALYQPTIPLLPCVQNVVTYLTNCVLDGTTLAQLPTASFDGVVQTEKGLTELLDYVAEAAYQHVEAYYQEIIEEAANQFKPLPPFDIDALAVKLAAFCLAHPNGQCQPVVTS